jgi:hypothetical protein
MALGAPERLAPATVLRRGAVLVALGLFLSGFPYFNPSRWRIPGVLQRIGLCYVITAFVWQALAARGDAPATVRRLAGAIAVCLLGYWALIALVAPPGGMAGDLTAEGNLGAWLDRTVFGTHLWRTTWDPGLRVRCRPWARHSWGRWPERGSAAHGLPAWRRRSSWAEPPRWSSGGCGMSSSRSTRRSGPVPTRSSPAA